jgi:hypothetical protein
MSIRKPLLHAAGAICLLVLGTAVAVKALPQSSDQQKCLNALNKDGVNVAKAQGKEFLGCLKDKGKGKLVGSAQDCLTADPKLKVQKKRDKTVADEVKSCTPPPDFGYAGATAVNDAAVAADLDLVADVFGADLDPVVIDCVASKDGCKCQQQVAKGIEKQAQTKLKLFLKCKKNVLKNGAGATADLNGCLNDAGNPDSLAADTKLKIAKGVEKLEKAVVKKCDEKGVTAGAFPGDCTGLSGAALAACLDVLVECRVCQMLNETDALFVNCDLFDDGAANGSCDSGTGPTPTPTLTPMPTPTMTVGPVEVQGALPSTVGRFNYNLTLGLPGADAACNTNFPGTHACEHSELLLGEAAGDLVGLQDTAANTVTSFWVIDRSNNADINQCNDDAAIPGVPVPGTNWEYGTAHTPSRGQRVDLNNGAGTLGAVQAPQQCNFSSRWVGCCL